MNRISKPLVSIIINNYNYEQFVGSAIESAINQDYSNIEIVVVDDGSVDKSKEIIQRYFNYIKPVFKENSGQSSALNCGFKHCQGDIVVLLDSDDLFLPNKVSTVVELFLSRPDIDWCFHPLKCIDINSDSILSSNSHLSSMEWDKRLEISRKGHLSYVYSATSGLCFRRSLLNKIFPLPEAIKITSDNYLKFAASALGKAFFIGQELSIQKIHGDNAYSYKKNNSNAKAEVLLLTAYWLRVKFPSLSKFANGLFILGIKTVNFSTPLDVEYSDLIQKYFNDLEFFESIRVKCIVLVFKLKSYGSITKAG